MKLFVLTMLILLGLQGPAHAKTNEEFCQELNEAKKELKGQELPNLTFARFQLILHKIFPSLSYRLRSSGTIEKGMKGERRGLIVAFGVPSDDKSGMQEYEKLQEQMKDMTKDLLKVFKQKDPARCVKKAKDLGFEAQAFLDLRESIAAMVEQKRFLEYQQVMGAYGRLSKKMKARWEIRPAFHAAELKELMDSQKIDHLVIVAHATNKGHVTDSFGNFLPTGLFEGLPGKLKSLSFFTCHGEKVVEGFKLREIPEGTKVFWPESKSPLLADVTILPALPSFMKKISKEIDRARLAKAPLTEECSLEINAGKIEGEAALLLGDKYMLGHVKGEEQKTFSFDCALLEKENMLSIRSLQSQAALELKESWELSIQGPQGERRFELIQDFIKDGAYQGSLLMLE